MITSALCSALWRMGLASLSFGAGVFGYLLHQDGEAKRQVTVRSAVCFDIVSGDRETVLDAEPVLLARAENPVDLDWDAAGATYVLERGGGLLRIAAGPEGAVEAHPYAQLGGVPVEESLGFASLALHPGFLAEGHPGRGKFYAVVAERAGAGAPDFRPEFGGPGEHHQDVLYEYTLACPLAPGARVERRELLRLSQPGPEHNLGSIAFDPEGRLYLASGDGAEAAPGRRSPSRNASSLTSAYGKVLRIDPLGRDSANGRYGIPGGNPFRLVTEALPELWCFGLRAPHSITYDPFRNQLCIVDTAPDGTARILASAAGAEHFGWDLGESAELLGAAARAELAKIVTPPLLSVHPGGAAPGVAGGLIYQGGSFPTLAGRVVVASGDGRLMSARTEEGAKPRFAALGLPGLRGLHPLAVRPGVDGELVLLCRGGGVYEMRKSHTAGSAPAARRALLCWSAAAGGLRGPGA